MRLGHPLTILVSFISTALGPGQVYVLLPNQGNHLVYGMNAPVASVQVVVRPLAMEIVTVEFYYALEEGEEELEEEPPVPGPRGPPTPPANHGDANFPPEEEGLDVDEVLLVFQNL